AIEADEECDDGNVADGDGCSSQCKLETDCGNGVKEGVEECDDGNVQNGDGCSDHCTLESNTNHPPVADGGLDESVAPGATVTLDATGSSDPDGDDLTFAWTALDGAPALDDPTSPSPSLIAGDCGESYQYQLVVQDTHGATDMDEVTITVNDFGYHVSTSSCDQLSQCGSIQHPWCSINQGVQAAKTSSYDHVLVAEGDYNESVTITQDLILEGGYAPDFVDNDPVAHRARILSTDVSAVTVEYAVKAALIGFEIGYDSQATCSTCRLVHNQGELTVQHCDLNATPNGNGTQNVAIHTEGSDPHQSLTVEDSIVVAHDAQNLAAGIMSEGSPMTVKRSTVMGGDGCGPEIDGIWALNADVTVEDSTVVGRGGDWGPFGSPGLGCGLELDHCTATLRNNHLIQGGDADSALGIDAEGGTLVLDHNDAVRGASLNRAAGALAIGVRSIQASSVTITDNSLIAGGPMGSVTGNRPSSSVGMWIEPNGQAHLSGNVLIVGNDGPDPTLQDCTSEGLYLNGGTVTIEDSELNGGAAAGMVIGAELGQVQSLTMTRTTIKAGSGGYSDHNGGAIGLGCGGGTSVAIDACWIEGAHTVTTAAKYSHGVELSGGCPLHMTNTVVLAGASTMESVGLYYVDSSPVVTNCYINAQGATGGWRALVLWSQGGSDCNDTQGQFRNNIMDPGELSSEYSIGWFEGARPEIMQNNDMLVGSFGDYIFLRGCNQGTNSIADVNGLYGSDFQNNISADPKFVNPATKDFHLQATSPCVDEGLGTNDGAPDHDFDNPPTSRPQGGGVDIGPDER
ncbi:MAG: hypothetical protein J7M25_13835, partial [Deltaproteobacteria bacterium]|nr:hypothetical protein [Deltaproteobacteria bacterium]